jgi:predicted GNAT family N-acyltransferase
MDVFRWDEAEQDEFVSRDSIARTACLFDEYGTLAAAGRMYYAEGAFWMEAIAVRGDLRGQGYGDLLARMMLDRALQHAAREVRITAPKQCEGFFGRYGFETDTYNGAIVSMRVRAEDVRLGGNCG